MSMKHMRSCLLLLVLAGLCGCAAVKRHGGHTHVIEGRDSLFVCSGVVAGPAAGPIGFARSLLDLVTGGCPELILSRPTDVDVGLDGRIYVADGDLARAVCYSGLSCMAAGIRLFGVGLLENPTGVEEGDGWIAVADAGLARVLLYDMDLNSAGELRAPEPWSRPGQMHWDGRRLLVTDPGRHAVEVFDGEGRWLHTLGTPGNGGGEFLHPVAVTGNATGDLWVLDALNHRVVSFDSTLRALSSFGVQDQAPGGMMFPKGLAVDSDDNLYLSDALFNRIQVFSPEGALLYLFGSAGSDEGQYIMPSALCVDELDRLFVVDQFNHRIEVLSYRPLQ